jgi:hypothetical protein
MRGQRIFRQGFCGIQQYQDVSLEVAPEQCIPGASHRNYGISVDNEISQYAMVSSTPSRMAQSVYYFTEIYSRMAGIHLAGKRAKSAERQGGPQDRPAARFRNASPHP